jgi:hypothetical protein
LYGSGRKGDRVSGRSTVGPRFSAGPRPQKEWGVA